jgi:hypothetical protein
LGFGRQYITTRNGLRPGPATTPLLGFEPKPRWAFHARLRAVQGQPELARADFDEARQIAERGPMGLHLADIHLHRARLFRDKEELKHARALIEQCGYWRRKQELENAVEAAKAW